MCPINFLAVVLTLTIASSMHVGSWAGTVPRPCKRCESQEECDRAPPQLCVYGESRDFCGRRVCSKGPGELCGDKFNVLGSCGEGMWCSKLANRCHGCLISTMDCYPK